MARLCALLALALATTTSPVLAQDAAPDAVTLFDAGSSDAEGDANIIFLPGTQPNQLTLDLRSPSLCNNCHGLYADYDANDTWKGTMMANAARDPLFHAALSIANQDITGSGELCLRCHSPRGWLFGRSTPPLIENLLPDDFESVQCDFCHRLTTGPTGIPNIGTAQFYVADDYVRRGPIQDALAPHDWVYSPYHEESRLCGLCHDVSNPLKNGFAIERTYTEWASSDFATEGKSCQSCHMPSERGQACGAYGMPQRDVHRHELAGGNYWMPLVLAGEHPELDRQTAFENTAANARTKLRSAAALTLSAPSTLKPGTRLALNVHVENLTGHKLPTGYPEGRRAWLEVLVKDGSGTVLLDSGAYDSVTATRRADPMLRTYEVRMAANGVEGFHFIIQDELIQDNRIPPRGFVAQPDTAPQGRTYPEVGTRDGGAVLANYDDAPYELDIPDSTPGPLTVQATFWYQTTSREYVESLRDANFTDDHGTHMAALFDKYNRAPPFAAATASATIALDTPDAGTDASSDAPNGLLPDGGLGDAAEDTGRIRAVALKAEGSGCSCRFSDPARSNGRLGPVSVYTALGLVSWLSVGWLMMARRRVRRGQERRA